MTPEPLVLSDPGRVWHLTLNRPGARNAVTAAMLDALAVLVEEAGSDPRCRALVLAGAGKDFCAGADVGDLLAARDGGDVAEYGRTLEGALGAIERSPRPVIAAVHGAALGAGCQMASACDLVVAAEDARFGIPSSRLGIVVNYENVERLVATVGSKRASEILLSARTLTGIEAVEWGLANEAVEAGALASAADSLAERVAALAPLSVIASKRGIRHAVAGSSEEGRAEFDALAAKALAGGDLLEGVAAFRERRPPAFEGR
jgi:enoyl-CoA hydratase